MGKKLISFEINNYGDVLSVDVELPEIGLNYISGVKTN